MLSAAKHLCTKRDRPFVEFTLSGAKVLRVTRFDRSNCQVQFVQIDPCLTVRSALPHRSYNTLDEQWRLQILIVQAWFGQIFVKKLLDIDVPTNHYRSME